MQNAFFERTGDPVDWHSDIGARLQTVASELLSLYAYSDFVLKQSMVQTAGGSYLDNHAALRDICRKTATKAAGALTFWLAEPQETAVTIPSGTVCAMKNRPFVQFITVQQGVIAAGETEVTVPAEATAEGVDGNAPEGTVTVMVNPPSEVLGVTNNTAFDGGFDDESDDALRRRVMDAYRICQTGFSPDSVREQLLQMEEIADAGVQFHNGEYLVCVLPKTRQLTPALEEAIRRRLAVTAVTDYPVTISCCTVKEVELVLTLQMTMTDNLTEEAVKERVKAFCGALRIGENLSLTHLAYALSALEGVRYCEATAVGAVEGTVFCDSGEALAAGTIEVNLYE